MRIGSETVGTGVIEVVGAANHTKPSHPTRNPIFLRGFLYTDTNRHEYIKKIYKRRVFLQYIGHFSVESHS